MVRILSLPSGASSGRGSVPFDAGRRGPRGEPGRDHERQPAHRRDCPSDHGAHRTARDYRRSASDAGAHREPGVPRPGRRAQGAGIQQGDCRHASACLYARITTRWRGSRRARRNGALALECFWASFRSGRRCCVGQSRSVCARDEEAIVRGVLADLVDSGLVFRSGRGDATGSSRRAARRFHRSRQPAPPSGSATSSGSRCTATGR